MLSFLGTIAAFVLAFGLVVTFHEFGHFWVARRFGVHIKTFSVGFGKPLWSWIGKDRTQYQVAAIPLGGYVSMLDHEQDAVSEQELQGSFRIKPVYQRFLIVLAGPMANFVFAVFVLWLMLMLGTITMKPVLGEVETDSVAAQAGLQKEDVILAINGYRVQDWQDVSMRLASYIGDDTVELLVRTAQGIEQQKKLHIENWTFDPDEGLFSPLGIQPYRPEVSRVIGQVQKNSAAELAGVQVGDEIIAIDQYSMDQWEQIREYIGQRAGQQVQVEVLRDGNALIYYPVLHDYQGRGTLGIAPYIEPFPEQFVHIQQQGPLQALPDAIERTWVLTALSFAMVKKLITGDISLQSISGPVGIAQGAGQHARHGVAAFLSFIALISVSLGVLNLLPIPMLDGGHLAFYIVEWVRGKPVPQAIQNVFFRIGLIALMLLMTIAFSNDFKRLFF